MKSIQNYDYDFIQTRSLKYKYHIPNETTWTCRLYSSIKQLAITKFKALKKHFLILNLCHGGDGIAADEVGYKYVKGPTVYRSTCS